MGRLAKGADVILCPAAVEAILCAAEDGSMSEPILGRAASDDAGRFYELTGSGTRVGMSVVMEDGGTEPDEGLVASFTESFPYGALVVVDPYAGEFSLFVSEDGALRRASAVMSE